MKKSVKQGLVLALMMCLCVSLLSVVGLAAQDVSIQANVGDSVWEVVDTSEDMDSYWQQSGSLAPGLQYGENAGCFIILGTPTTAGSYSSVVRWEDLNGVLYTVNVSMTISDPAAPTPTPPPATTPAPTAKPAAAPTATVSATPKITKNPTGETVTAGGSAYFVARADGASQIVWRIVQPDGSSLYEAQLAPSYIPGLSVSGQGTDTLRLSNIPLAMNGWSVECKFVGSDGVSKVVTSRAYLVVQAAATSTPAPTMAPTQAPTPEPAAASTPEPAVPAAVTDPTATPGPTPEPTPLPTSVPVQPAARRGNTLLYILLAALLLAIIAAVVIFLLSQKRRAEAARSASRARHTAGSSGWRCSCGAWNRGRFCQNCGAHKPQGALQYACDKCGWEPEDPTHPPKFCPECGDPFGEEDIQQ